MPLCAAVVLKLHCVILTTSYTECLRSECLLVAGCSRWGHTGTLGPPPGIIITNAKCLKYYKNGYFSTHTRNSIAISYIWVVRSDLIKCFHNYVIESSWPAWSKWGGVVTSILHRKETDAERGYHRTHGRSYVSLVERDLGPMSVDAMFSFYYPELRVLEWGENND